MSGRPQFDWAEARRLRAAGMSYTEIGRQLGVTGESARRVCDPEARAKAYPYTARQFVKQDVIDRIAGLFVFAEDGCWHWTGPLFSNGYGAFWSGKRNVRAHRAMYELLIGEIPAGLALDHFCRVRHCVNPAHLEPVTLAENNRRAARNPHATHCPKGHELSPENTCLERNGRYRRCRTCVREYARAYRAKRRALLAIDQGVEESSGV